VITVLEARIIEGRDRLRVGTVEDCPEVTGLGQRQVLDQAEQVGARSSQGASDVVLRKPVEFAHQARACLAQVVVKVLLGELVDHVGQHASTSN